MRRAICITIGCWMILGAWAQDGNWYYTHETSSPDELAFVPEGRLVYVLKNTLDEERRNYDQQRGSEEAQRDWHVEEQPDRSQCAN